ncbi:hypothetical protein ABIB27_000165 [Arthrobacter sp. UYEF21]
MGGEASDAGYAEADEAASPLGNESFLRLEEYAQGKTATKTYSASYLHWLLYGQGHLVQQELRALYWRVAPMTEAWHEG